MYALLCMPGWDNEIDIQKTIQLVRAQRSGMVQTEVCLSVCVFLVQSLTMVLLMCTATVQVCVPGNSCVCGVPASADGSGKFIIGCECMPY